MRHFVISIVTAFACVNTFASNPNNAAGTNNTPDTHHAKKSSVVYVWGNDTHNGMFFHNDLRCAQSFKENVSRGQVVDMTLKVTTEKGATARHIHECPFCGGHGNDTHTTAKK